MSRLYMPRHVIPLALTLVFEYYYKACRKGDPEVKAITMDQSPMGAIADAKGNLRGSSLNIQHTDNYCVEDLDVTLKRPLEQRKTGY
jgi:hypothetical protein